MRKKLGYLIKLFRIKQWVKNAFIFFPLLFSGNLFQPIPLFKCAVTFVGFCLIASSVYILNDFLDRKKDRLHPKKSDRPLAQNRINPSLVTLLILVTMALGLWVTLTVDPLIMYTAIFYIVVHLVYNFYTKNVVILDVIFVAIGFQVRVWAGSFAAGVMPSVWLQLCVFLLALFLGFTKRRHEIATLKDQAAEHRMVLAHYTTYLLDQIIIICSTLAIVFYGLYTISTDMGGKEIHHNMIYSIGFVIYGMFRYLYLVHVRKLGDDPGEVMFSDKPLMINIILWIGYSITILYFSI